MTRHPARRLTYADYLALPDDDLRHEIIGGEHFVTPSPRTRHQRISRDLLVLLANHLERHPIGEVFYAPLDVWLSDFDIVVPDLIYVSRARAHQLTEKNLRGAPDVVVEILSPGTRVRDQRLKRDLYERAGVVEYWLIDPDADTVTTYRRVAGTFGQPERLSKAGADVLTTPLLPGLEVRLDRLLG